MEFKRFDHTMYVCDESLLHAVEGAYDLNQPLLLTGEPGTGKTVLAKWALEHLKKKDERRLFHPELLQFNTKTTSSARDLFYLYDALSHYQATHIQDQQARVDTHDFIELQALGEAIAMSNPQENHKQLFKNKISETPLSSVVLIDEIDKASRDFTNDILDEILNYRFQIREKGNYKVEKGEEQKIFVVMTSNSEKNLPDAFLRRCAFYHIGFPDNTKLTNIVKKHLPDIKGNQNKLLKELIEKFEKIRNAAPRKKPATAELVNLIELLTLRKYFDPKTKPEGRKKLLKMNLSFLLKTKEDMEAIQRLGIDKL
jgi:MoxR-like ATPase